MISMNTWQAAEFSRPQKTKMGATMRKQRPSFNPSKVADMLDNGMYATGSKGDELKSEREDLVAWLRKKAKVEQVRATAERKKQVRYERITKEALLEMSRIAPSILSVDGLSVRLSFDRQNPEDVAAMNALRNHAAANLAALVADVPPEERERFIAAVFHIPEGLRKASDHE